MSDQAELLPCPFCASANVKSSKSGGGDERCGYNFSYQCSCADCGASVSTGSEYDKNGWCNEGDGSVKIRAFKRWNIRATPAEDVRAVGKGLVPPATDDTFIRGWRVGCNYFGIRSEAVKFIQSGKAEAAGNGTKLNPLYFANHPPRPVVLPERKEIIPGRESNREDSGWNACIDEFGRLNK